MAYTDIAATDTLSASREVLNGTKTRRVSLEFVRHHDNASPTTRATNGNIFTEGFSTGEICHAKWIVCDRVDDGTDATVRLHLFMQGAGTGSEVAAFDVGYFAIDPTQNDGSELSTQAPTVVSGSDVDVSAFLGGGHFVVTATIPNAAFSKGQLVFLEITRATPSGTDHPSDIGLGAVEVLYSIDR